MSRIKVRNFGPIGRGLIENDGWFDIGKVTVFAGNQGSGKSTVAKLISTFMWIEKALVRGDYDKKWFEATDRLKKSFLHYHRLDNYLRSDSAIEYLGDAYSVTYGDGLMSIAETANLAYQLPQIMYVPSERNFLASINGAEELRLSSEALRDFSTEYNRAKNDLQGTVRLPVNETDVEYISLSDKLYLKGNDYRIEISEASSGFQSFVPLYLVSKRLAYSVKNRDENKESMSSKEEMRFKSGVREIWDNENLTDEQRRMALSALTAKFNKTAFINIVEEPEQNLFTSSQWELLRSLLEFNNMNAGNKLIATTHSPYLTDFLILFVKAGQLKSSMETDELKRDLNAIVPMESTVNIEDLSIYEFDDRNGAINILEPCNGLPSDENILNGMFDESNEMFARLLEIQQRMNIKSRRRILPIAAVRGTTRRTR